MGSATPQPNVHRDLMVTTIRVEREKLDRFREIVREEHLSVNQALRRMIDERIERALTEESDAA